MPPVHAVWGGSAAAALVFWALLCVSDALEAPAHNYSLWHAAISGGNDLSNGTHTLSEAFGICDANSECRGFTYHSLLGKDNLTSPIQIFFKKAKDLNQDPSWSSYLKDVPPPPPPTPKLINPCANFSSAQSKLPWCDHTLELSARVKDMIRRMSIKEKIGSLRDQSAPIVSLELPYYGWWSEATHGVASGPHGARNTVNEPYQTNFPFPITTGMAFNRTLWKAIGSQIGKEARAFMNMGNAFSTFWAPVINLAREPRWGRNIECPGECPYLSGQYAVEFVQGFERNPDDTTHIQASACSNSMEHATEGFETFTRHNIDANITMQDLVDSYLSPFQACVEKGKVSGLMCSYNAINGKPTCADGWLLQEVARDSWNFDGYITSDCGAESDVYINHHFTNTPEESVAAVIKAGTDNDCGGFLGEHAQSALNKGLVTEADLDVRLAKLFRVRMRLGHFDPPTALSRIPPSTICSEEAVAMARDSVTQSVALLKNDNARLPLGKGMKTATVVGPTAKQPWSIESYYGPSTSCNDTRSTMVDAIAQHVADAQYVAGLPTTLSMDISGVPAAVAAAEKADVVVLALGTDLSSAHEEMDAVNISLPWGQLALLSAVTNASKSPVVVVMLTAVPLDISSILHNDKVGAVVHAGQPSVQTLGIGDVLFGLRSPAGRLIQTIYPEAYAGMISIFDFNMRPGPSHFPRPDCTAAQNRSNAGCPRGTNPGRTYRFYTEKPVLPFGFGLSFTSWNYQLLGAHPTLLSLSHKLSSLLVLAEHRHGFVPDFATQAAGPATQFKVVVTNTGDVDSDDVVLGFLTPPGAGIGGKPLKQLYGFERVHVLAKQAVTVMLYPQLVDFTTVATDGSRVADLGDYIASFGVDHTEFGVESGRVGYVVHKLQVT